MMHENQWTECLGLQWRFDDLKRKKKIVKDDRGEPTKDLSTVKSVFFLEHKDNKWVNSRTYLDWVRLSSFIESWEWVYFLGTTDIVGDMWT